MAIGGPPQRLGEITRTWDGRLDMLTFDYHASHESRTLHRAVRIRMVRSDSAPRCNTRELTFDIMLPSRGSWHAELAYEVFVDETWRSPIADRAVLSARNRFARQWQSDRAHVESDPSSFGVVVERAADDLGALRNWEYDVAPDAWIPNAGVPTYTGLFGRDTLTAAC